MHADPAGRPAAGTPWQVLRAVAASSAAALDVPSGDVAGLCGSCRGPVRPGRARCFHCALHAESAPGMLADVVAPASYAPKGGPLATHLWQYKSGRPEARQAGTALLALLLVFLHDHGPRIWQRAGMAAPTHACVAPSGRGRPGPHPLQALVSGYLSLPWVMLRARPGCGPWARDLDPDRFVAPRPVTGAAVLLLDDTWTSGGTVQSAAVALKRAGAGSVAAVVLGRHVESGALVRLPGQ